MVVLYEIIKCLFKDLLYLHWSKRNKDQQDIMLLFQPGCLYIPVDVFDVIPDVIVQCQTLSTYGFSWRMPYILYSDEMLDEGKFMFSIKMYDNNVEARIDCSNTG